MQSTCRYTPFALAISSISGVMSTPSMSCTPCCRNQKPVPPVPQAKSAAVAIASQSIEVSASRSGQSKPVATVAS